nr:hypothetical protein [Tanacetum cinerariifolium]
MLPFDPEMPALEDIITFNFSSDHEDDVEEADMNNIDTTIQVSHTPTIRIYKDHPLDQVIGDLHLTTQTKNMSKNLEDHSFVTTIHQRTNHKDLQNCLFACFLSQEEPKKIEEEVYVYQPLGFEDPNFSDKVYKVKKSLYGLHQAPKAWYETLSTYLLDNGFHTRKIDKTLFIRRHKDDILLVQVYVDDIIFGELTFFLGLKVKQKQDGIFISQDKYVAKILKEYGFSKVNNASTPMETQKPLLKDEDGKEVDVHMYRSMIGSFMYLTSSMPDIMFAVCACARYQYKKQPVVANSTIKAEYVAASSITYYCWVDVNAVEGGGPMCQEAMRDTAAQTRVKKLKRRKRSRTHGLKRLYKIGLLARVESSADEGLGEEDAFEQGRIADIDTNEDITLVSTHNEQMFDVDQDLGGEEVFVVQQDQKVIEKEVDDVQI